MLTYDTVFNIADVHTTTIFIHDVFVNLTSKDVYKTSLCVQVMKEDVIHVDSLNKLQCEYGPMWGRYVYVFSSLTSLPLCEIEIYKESGMYNINIDFVYIYIWMIEWSRNIFTC